MKIKRILKGILLWTTMIVIILFVSGIESLVNNPLLGVIWFISCVILLYTCRNIITFNELLSLSLYKWFYKKSLL